MEALKRQERWLNDHLLVRGAEEVHQGRHCAMLDQHVGVLSGARGDVGEGPQGFYLHRWALVELQPTQQEGHPVAVENLIPKNTHKERDKTQKINRTRGPTESHMAQGTQR